MTTLLKNTNNRQNHHNPTNQHTRAHMAHKMMMTIDGTEYTLEPVAKVPTEATPNKSEKKRKPDDDVVEHAPKKVSAYNMYVKEQRADVTKKLTELHMSKPSNEQVMQAIALRWNNLKDGAKKGDKDDVAKMLQYTTSANEASISKKHTSEIRFLDSSKWPHFSNHKGVHLTKFHICF